ncbi:cytochrome P450 [Kribbella aluminosa]|uniref:Cytochrome P450 n=1 Tax=Kribbella aluminosa TaxID=416017 RepID=A0ABS4UIM3_9ACTN|nr:cytochrome P450 [Kribbella aluminosa]MBP2351464.1 cytochrome P450 [Kribbella aluminosa]
MEGSRPAPVGTGHPSGRAPQPSRLADPALHQVDPTDPWSSWSWLTNATPVVRLADEGESARWHLLGYEQMKEALQDPVLFSSRNTAEAFGRSSFELIPGELDPPEHRRYRQLLNPAFAPGAIKVLEPAIRQVCNELIDGFQDRGGCDLIADFAFLFPTTIFLRMLGLPDDRRDEFVDWTHRFTRPTSPEDRQVVQDLIDRTLGDVFAARRDQPREDMASFLVTCELDGRPLEVRELLGIGRLLFIAGLDTVAATLGWCFHHLAFQPGQRRHLIEHPDSVPLAVEEFLRYYSVVTSTRSVSEDTELTGCPIKKGDIAVVPLAPANRDPRSFPDADEFLIERRPNRHVGFGLGPHRCLGAHLARTELRIALEEWHRRIPDYVVPDGVELPSSGFDALYGVGTSVPMLDSLPLVWK